MASLLNSLADATAFVNALGSVLLPLAYLSAAAISLVLIVLLAPIIKGVALLVGLVCHVVERVGYSLLARALPVRRPDNTAKFVPEGGVELCGISVSSRHLTRKGPLLVQRGLRHRH